MLIFQVSEKEKKATAEGTRKENRISEFQGKAVNPVNISKKDEKAQNSTPKSLVLSDVEKAKNKEKNWLNLEVGTGAAGIGFGILGAAVNRAFYPAWVVFSIISGAAYLFRENAKKEKEEAMVAAGLEIAQPSMAKKILFGVESVAGGMGIACGIGGFFVRTLWPIGVAASVISGIAYGLRQLFD